MGLMPTPPAGGVIRYRPAVSASGEAAAAFAGVSARTIYRCVESGELDFIDTSEGALLICSGSFKSEVFHREGDKLKCSDIVEPR